MNSSSTTERRRSRRYLAKGQVTLQAVSGEIPADLVNIGRGGMLVKGDGLHSIGTNLVIYLTISGYHAGLEAQGQVIGTKSGLVAIQFLGETTGIGELLAWLDRENFIWTGTDAPEDLLAAHPPQNQQNLQSPPDTVQASEEDLETLRAYLHQLG